MLGKVRISPQYLHNTWRLWAELDLANGLSRLEIIFSEYCLIPVIFDMI